MLTKEEVALEGLVAAALCAALENDDYFPRVYEAFLRYADPATDPERLKRIRNRSRIQFIRRAREEWGNESDDSLRTTTTPNPNGNCDDCLHPYGFYDKLFPAGAPQDISECICPCHDTESRPDDLA